MLAGAGEGEDSGGKGDHPAGQYTNADCDRCDQ